MTRISSSKLVIAVGICWFAPSQSGAQPLFGHAESLESTVANADLVFVGKLLQPGGNGQADERGRIDGVFDIEFHMKQDLFATQPHRRFRTRLAAPASSLADWKAHSRRLLVAVQEDAPDSTRVLALGEHGSDVLTADFKLLRDPDEVIRVARETVRRIPAPVRRIHTFPLAVPREAVAGTKWEPYYGSGGHLVLQVPVDDRLETRAWNAIRSGNYQGREEAARALRYFKTDGNVARLRSLLVDPGWAYVYHAEENHGVEVRIYGVREAAYLTLKSWGVEAEIPLIREEVKK